MPRGYEGSLYILAFDHRGSFVKKFFKIEGTPNAEQTETISDAKRVIYEGFRTALDKGAPKDSAGVLVDEQFGGDVPREAVKDGLILAMPVEKSGQNEFDFDYGDDFGTHIEEFNPTFSKVLVRYNPEGDQGMNERQTKRLKRLSDWLAEHEPRFLFELLVPAEEAQLAKVDGDTDRYDKEIRPGLMLRTIKELQDAGVEPDVWKIEGIDTREDCERISEQVRSGGRDNVVCVVLGRGADDAAVEHWLKTGAGVPGYIGFAIGRTIWWDPLKGYVDGEIERADASSRIADKYSHFIDVYNSAG